MAKSKNLQINILPNHSKEEISFVADINSSNGNKMFYSFGVNTSQSLIKSLQSLALKLKDAEVTITTKSGKVIKRKLFEDKKAKKSAKK